LGLPLAREAWALQRFKLDTAVRIKQTPGRVAVVGCGTIGRAITRAVNLLDRWTVAGLYDRYPAAARRLQADLAPQATVYDTLEALLANRGAWDILVVATTADSHVAVAHAALDAGARKIWVEKPIATCLADADALSIKAQHVGAQVMVDHTRRWIAAGKGLRRLIDSGVIGKARAMQFTFGRSGLSMIGTHLFDFARWLFDAEIVELRAELDAVRRPSRRGAQFIDPSGRCQALLSNGVRVTLDLSDDLVMKHAFFVVFGAGGRIEVDERLGRMRLVGYGGRVWEEGYLGGPSAFPLGVATALFELQEGKASRCTMADGRAALEAAIACQLSAREGGRWVTLPLQGDIYDETFPFA
jgi:myo-inositol 2-dehydrogenase/D-chiro-inositol 1-dehydrogenase